MFGNVENPQIAWSSLQTYDMVTIILLMIVLFFIQLYYINLSIHYVPQASRVSNGKHHEKSIEMCMSKCSTLPLPSIHQILL